MKELAQCLLKHLIKGEEGSRGIIFVKTRAMTTALCNWLNRFKELKVLNAERFTGARAAADEEGLRFHFTVLMDLLVCKYWKENLFFQLFQGFVKIEMYFSRLQFAYLPRFKCNLDLDILWWIIWNKIICFGSLYLL